MGTTDSAYLTGYLAAAGIDLSVGRQEEDAVVEGWLNEDCAHERGATDVDRFRTAVLLGRSIYRTFMDAYNAAFLCPGGRGIAEVRYVLTRRFGRADDNAEDAALNRIRERRLKLLHHIRRKCQPSLFGSPTFDPSRLPGYMRKVAQTESLKLNQDDLPWKRRRASSLQRTATPLPYRDERETDHDHLARLLSGFWCAANGFKPEHHLEGLVSLGLGRLTDNPVIEERCRGWLSERLPLWENRRDRLRSRISQLMSRLQELNEDLRGTPARGEAIAAAIANTNDQLAACQRALARHPLRLRPKPAEVGFILAGFMRQKAGAVRHERIRCEIALFQRRATRSFAALSLAAPVCARVEAHRTQVPPSPRQHRLAPEEKRQRLDRMRAWLAEAHELLLQVSECRRHAPEKALSDWASDIEDLYHYGLLCRKGVLAALGHRHGIRLEQLLRVEGKALDGGQGISL